MKKKFTLIIVRHGEGFHQLPHTKDDLEFTDELHLKTINSALTEKGLMQASRVADRFKNMEFDLAISSDLKRARQTAEAIMYKNASITNLKIWRIVRERCLGDIAGNGLELFTTTVEDAVPDRDYLTWKPPNGESVVDLRHRVVEFLQEIQKEAMAISVDSPVILVSSHGLFMKELYRVLSTSEAGRTLPRNRPRYQNTGFAQYDFITSLNENSENVLEEVNCSILSCANHLENYDPEYLSRRGGCHGHKEKD